MYKFCFANHGGECAALHPKQVRCKGCRFYKTRSKAEADIKHALALIAARPPEEQAYIAAKYYQGAMPWKEGKHHDDQ